MRSPIQNRGDGAASADNTPHYELCGINDLDQLVSIGQTSFHDAWAILTRCANLSGEAICSIIKSKTHLPDNRIKLACYAVGHLADALSACQLAQLALIHPKIAQQVINQATQRMDKPSLLYIQQYYELREVQHKFNAFQCKKVIFAINQLIQQ